MEVTVVGAGHYGRELIGPKYAKNKYAKLKAVISPTVSEGIISQSVFANTPLLRSPQEWEKKFGCATAKDIFDLCVHATELPNIVRELVNVGTKNFIFPKPVALTEKNLKSLLEARVKHDLKIAIASQWHYAKITSELKTLIEKLSQRSTITKVDAEFSAFRNDERLKKYSMMTSIFLPHMLQIIYSTKLSNFSVNPAVETSGKHKIVLHYGRTHNSPEIILKSDLKAESDVRIVKVFFKGEEEPKIVASYLGVFRDGKALKCPFVQVGKEKKEVIEDNLETMLNKILRSFINGVVSDDNPALMTLVSYLPIAREQIKIEKLKQK